MSTEAHATSTKPYFLLPPLLQVRASVALVPLRVRSPGRRTGYRASPESDGAARAARAARRSFSSCSILSRSSRTVFSSLRTCVGEERACADARAFADFASAREVRASLALLATRRSSSCACRLPLVPDIRHAARLLSGC